MTRILKLCSALLLAIAATGAQAANYAGTTFEIEMIIFERSRGMEQSRETWPAAPQLQYPSRWVNFDTAEGGALLLSPAAARLGNKAAALNRGGDRVLFHKAWRQVLRQKRNSPAILISGGERMGDHSRLGGSVTLSVSRYLHLSADLWLIDFAGNPADSGVLLPQRPEATTEEPLDLMRNSADFQPAAISANAPQPVYARHVAPLQAERRMRSGELHYIDHPAFGILIEVRSVAQQEEETAGE